MSKFRTYVAYKMRDGGKVYRESPALFAEVQICCACNKMHAMPLEKRTLKCSCGNVIDRRANAAVNEFEQSQIVKLANEVL